jgi:triosephosphate isomerase (TIM)
MRRPIVVGNWKMNMLISNSNTWVEEFIKSSNHLGAFDIVIAPPFTSLSVICKSLEGTKVQLAGQNMASEREGALTGEVSALMLKEVGCSYVLLGHSERRQYYAESNELINKKIFIACENELNVIFCIGESIEDRNKGEANNVLEKQLLKGLEGLIEGKLNRIAIAYEPIWAIGSGVTPSPNQVQDVHSFIRNWCKKSFGKNIAEAIRILYGGSVDSQNSPPLMALPDVDGLLIGGASLRSKSFYDIIKSSFEV